MQAWHKSYAAYLFDLDGTLIDTAPDLHAALTHTLTTAGYKPCTEAMTRHWIGHGARAMIREALVFQNCTAVEDEVERLFQPFLDYYAAHPTTHSKLYPGVVSTLTALQLRGAHLAVVTNKIEQLTHPILTNLELDQFFSSVIGGDTATHPKPDAAPVQLAMDELGVGTDETLFVGDSETDVLAANAAGIPVVCVRDGYNHGVDVATLSLDGVIDSFADLL